jgi:hypothetical protein
MDEVKMGDGTAFKAGLLLGVSLGFACSAGATGECDDMNHRQIGAMLENMVSQPEIINAVVDAAYADAMGGGALLPKRYQDLIADLVRRVRPQ